MSKKFYIKSNGAAVDVLTKEVYYKDGGTAHLFKEGDFVKTGGVATPILRFDTIPFGGRVSGTDMVFQFGISDKLLTENPKVVCLGSSTMAGMGLSAPNRLEDRLNAWLATNATGATLINYALGGQTMAAMRPTASGGTVGRNIDTALSDNPTIVFIDEPTNWAASYDVATQISYMEEIFEYAFARGVLVVFSGSRPRTPYSGTQDARLVDLNTTIAAHPYLKYVTSINFADFLQPSTVADLRTDYDQGDGIHLNSTGVLALADSISACWQRVFRAVTAFDQYEIENSADGSTGWALNQTITDMTVNQLIVAAATGYYRTRARLKDGSYTDYSEAVYLEEEETEPVADQRILVDIGGDGVNDFSISDTGVMTPSNAVGSGNPGQDGAGRWWNNVVDGRAGIWLSDPKDTNNVTVSGFSISVDKKPAGTYAPAGPDYSINFGGTNAAVSEYPAPAVRDNVYFHTSAGIVTATVTVPAGRVASIKFWGNRAATGPRVLQIRKAGDATWQEYEAANNTNFNTAVTISGLTGTSQIEMQVKSGSDFGHISILDTTITSA